MSHPLRAYYDLLHLELPSGVEGDQSIDGLSYDSREVPPQSLFICKGAHFSPAYLDQAIAQGAIAYVSEIDYQRTIPCLQVSDIRSVLAALAAFYYDHPERDLSLFAITGTKGKTTSAHYLHTILTGTSQRPVGLFSSTNIFDGRSDRPSSLTTPEPIELFSTLASCRRNGCREVVMEVSSQALKYGRISGLELDHAGFLNISEDHISSIEHRDFEDYFSSKLKIFAHARHAYLNLDADYQDRLFQAAQACEWRTSFSMKEPADYRGRLGADRRTGFELFVQHADEEVLFQFSNLGAYNAENALLAIAMAGESGRSLSQMVDPLAHVRIEGRSECFECLDGGVVAMVDYAHNRLSFEMLFDEVDQLFPEYQTIAIFGAPGVKAQNRRKDLGEVAGQRMDLSILTLEDPKDEDPQKICEEIAHYVKQAGGAYRIIVDREEAVRTAFQIARKAWEEQGRKSLILILGKGTEPTHTIRGREVEIPSDYCLAKELTDQWSSLCK